MHLVGRGAELAHLDRAWRAAAHRPGAVFVEGGAGLGKSALAAHFTAKTAATVLSGAAPDLGGDARPFAPFVTALGELDPARPRAALFADALARIEAAAPVVLVLEDLHRADQASLDLLGYLITSLRRGGVLVLATAREAVRLPREVDRIALERLSDADIARLMSERAHEQPDPATVRRAAGNPLLAELLAVAPEANEPLLAGFRALPPQSRAVVRVASVLGQDVDLALLHRIAGPVEDEHLRAAVEGGVLAAVGDGYRFRHALIRGAVHDDLTADERARLHRLAAEAITATLGFRPPAGALVELAEHWHAAGDVDRAFDAAWRAAAAARFAHSGQLRLLERVVRTWPQVFDPEFRTRTDRLAVFTAAAVAALHAAPATPGDATAVTAPHPTPTTPSHATAVAAPHATPATPGDAAPVTAPHTTAVAALHAAPATPGDATAVATPHAAPATLGDAVAGLVGRGLALIEEGLRLTRDPVRTALLLETRAQLRHRAGEDGIEDLRAALALQPHSNRVRAILAGRLEVLARSPEAYALAQEAAGDRDPAVRALALVTLAAEAADPGPGANPQASGARVAVGRAREAVALAREGGDDGTELLARVVEAGAFEAAGESRAAVEAAEAGRAVARRTDPGAARNAMLAATHARSLTALGEWNRARSLIEEALDLQPPPVYRAALTIAAGRLDALEGHRERAVDAVRAGGEAMIGRYTSGQLLIPLWELRTLLGEAVPLDDRELPAYPALAWSLLLAQPEPDRRFALRLPVNGPAQRAASLTVARRWDEAIAAWRAVGHPYRLARTLLRAGRAARDKSTAVVRAREAAALANRLGARPLAEEAAALQRTGRLEPGAGRLTERELEVLRLLADGRTNQQISDELAIAVKTAGVHITSILAKLGVHSRAEAATVARRRGLLDQTTA
ncbi:helix-turn-helix transcriptional regulator [Dactylosporangium sp. CS-033363]|uniref:helix-turn-helix transcriptional regulator n=1 Tax=Dactylosporangium sp. CS-033363 TaxID=3239935 RepID=UPI003D8BD3D9